MMLYCNNDKCKRDICTLCLKDHVGHNVVDVKDNEIKYLRDQLQSFKDEITKVKKDVQRKSDEIVTKVRKSRAKKNLLRHLVYSPPAFQILLPKVI